jgi:hypothetical protein
MGADTYEEKKRRWTTTSPPICTGMNNYVKIYDYTMIFVEFYIANSIAKVYVNMVSIDILVNTAVAAYDTKNPAAAAEPLPPPRYDKDPPPPQIHCRHRRTTIKTRYRRRPAAAAAQ